MAPAPPDKLSVLIGRAQQHDEEALAALLDAYSERLLGSVRAELGERLRQRLESQDVMQQVYLDALGSIEQFVDRGPDSFFAWLRRIAVNRICDFDRKAFQTTKRGGEVRAGDLQGGNTMGPLLDALGGTVSTPSEVVGRAERARLLQQSLDQLTEDQREVIQLRYLRQLNVAETAAKMDRTERAVRSLCVRALIRLRELLGDAV
ncbi:MAG TPA: sigma-70 family RNA polymerase sigma factor [Phycisphaerae bacterium]|nr:sigma-70 family RNA polymerase sigma factor [Phycisphaerae bacterium]HNU46573.1 sigma-70 family RNA polymerase sigma factor [Phycisphaerae bacterium]